jgi:branched-chain amino acid transport system permease protein
MNFSVLTSQFWSLMLSGISLGLIYVLIALGYTMVYGVLRLINFANSEIFMVGTFAVVFAETGLTGHTLDSEPLKGVQLILTLGLAMLIAMVASGFTAVMVEILAYRRLRARGSNRLASLISAIGMSIALSEAASVLTHARPQSNPRLLEKTSLGEIAGANFRIDTVLVLVAAIVMFLLLDRFVNKTRVGIAIRAVSMSEENAKLMGVNLNRVISVTFLVGGIMTGAAAFLFMTVYETTKFNVGFSLGLAAFTAAVLGGIGNLRGAFWGGITLGILETMSAAVLGSQWKAVTVFVVLVLVLLVRPNGLFGEAIQQARA